MDTVVDSDTLSFAVNIDESNDTVNPFYAAGVFNKDAQVPELTPSVSGGAVTGVSISYGTDGYQVPHWFY